MTSLQFAQKTSYTSLASANSEASDWHPMVSKAHTAFSLCGFFVRSSLLLYGWTVWGAERLADYLRRRYANPHGLLTPIGIGMGRFKNLV